MCTYLIARLEDSDLIAIRNEEMDRAYFSFSYFGGKDLGELDIIVKLMSGACTFVAENLPDDFPWDSIYSILCDAN